jgi:hypothetical protein
MAKLTAFLAVLAFAFVLSLILSIPTMLLWDWLMPTIFNLNEITLLQAWGLNLLSAILFNTTVNTKS